MTTTEEELSRVALVNKYFKAMWNIQTENKAKI